MRLGFGEILIILTVLLLIFGANKIPQLGEALGKGIRNFRKSAREDDSIDVTPEKEQASQLGAGSPAATPSAATPSTSAANKKS